ncbi:NrfD/PsrC family molybdoenzyme membrane anchor subunit [Sporomusa sphaeroides]|uniref:NrfD/PsrC family molybdoenzyme membrane anchor subunit n=1 Tax=Sporomusa sphaeroides TaxID=47679 RepID=UPI002CCB9AB5|nr:NrfD/PsrC family molybdoenzyme membrane anchor subunit [Sporomusa sphaeroides]HML32007.1 polysulfide reductase NrfD [Sporomusa sphaeroides]
MNKVGKSVLAVLFVIGALTALGKVFIWGDSVTNLGSYVPWGLWVGSYISLVGVAGGAAWLGIYSAWQNGGQPNRFTSVSFIVAGASLAMGQGFIGMDLGKPLLGSAIFLNPSFSSKLTWASWLYTVFFGCLGGYFFTQAKKIFMYLAGVVAIGFLLAEGLFFGGMVARTLWYGMLTPVAFFTSALVGGSAAVKMIGLLSNKEILETEGPDINKILLYSLIAHVIVEAAHGIAGINSVGSAIQVKNLWSAWTYWGLFITVGVIIPVFLLVKTNSKQLLPPVLALIGMIAYKYSFIRYSFSTEPLAGIEGAFQHARLSLTYVPSLVEWLVAVGFFAGVLLLSQLAIDKLINSKEAKAR